MELNSREQTPDHRCGVRKEASNRWEGNFLLKTRESRVPAIHSRHFHGMSDCRGARLVMIENTEIHCADRRFENTKNSVGLCFHREGLRQVNCAVRQGQFVNWNLFAQHRFVKFRKVAEIRGSVGTRRGIELAWNNSTEPLLKATKVNHRKLDLHWIWIAKYLNCEEAQRIELAGKWIVDDFNVFWKSNENPPSRIDPKEVHGEAQYVHKETSVKFSWSFEAAEFRQQISDHVTQHCEMEEILKFSRI